MRKPLIDPSPTYGARRSSAGLAPQSIHEEAGLHAVIYAMRRIQTLRTSTGAQRTHLIDECRLTLNASSVALCRVSPKGELAIIHLSGNPPDPDAVEEIIACVPKRSRQSFSNLHRRESSDLVLAGRGSNILSATLPAGAEPWTEHVLAFVAERLVSSAVNPSRSAETAPVPLSGLVLPSEMVVGPSVAMRELLQQMSATVRAGIDVLLSGETGTGKELLARTVHGSGPTSSGPFVAINCAAIPGELLEAELFGVERRVATGVDPRTGLFLEADRGSVFLDEIAELPPRLQAKLLRVIQEREVLAVGASRPRRISVRIISASNQELSTLVAEGRFRADLYYRLRGLEFRSPPLRHRPEDIPALALAFLGRAAEEYGKDVAGISNAAIELLQQYSWPGNIRELQTEIRRAVLICPNGDSLQKEQFASLSPRGASHVPETAVTKPRAAGDAADGQKGAVLLRERLAAIERGEIETALRTANGNRSLAARLLGITRNGLAHKLRRLGLVLSHPDRLRTELRRSAK